MKLLFVGDIVGNSGREVFMRLVPGMKARAEADVVIANAENAAGGSGLTEKLAEDLFSCGCDVITLGDHVWDKKEFFPYLSAHQKIVRPANYSVRAPGKGSCLLELPGGVIIGVIVLAGRTFMKYFADCPFASFDRVVEEMRLRTSLIFVDIHAEATSEKVAMGWYADGRVSAVFGTHTHIQTADEKILPKGTAYITDVGMTGPYDSVIGQTKGLIIERYLTGMPNKFQVADTPSTLCGVVVDVDEKTGLSRSIVRIQKASE